VEFRFRQKERDHERNGDKDSRKHRNLLQAEAQILRNIKAKSSAGQFWQHQSDDFLAFGHE